MNFILNECRLMKFIQIDVSYHIGGLFLMDLNKQAIEHIKQDELEKAAELFTQFIEKHPEDPVGYINFGNLLLHMKDTVRAKNFFKRAIALDEKAATAHYGLGNVYFEESSFSDAQEQFNKAIELGLKDGDVYYMLGMSLLYLDHFQLAMPYLLRATELDPDDEEKLFQYGLTLAQSDYIPDAKSVFEDVLNRNDAHSDAHYNLGVIFSYENDFTKALHHFDQALRIQPDHLLASNGKENLEGILNHKEM